MKQLWTSIKVIFGEINVWSYEFYPLSLCSLIQMSSTDSAALCKSLKTVKTDTIF